MNLNGSASNSDFSLPLNNERQPTTNCTGPSESNQNSNNNKSENTNTNENENEHPQKAKKIHGEEQNRYNENFQSQQSTTNDYMKNCPNFTNFFIKNNNIMPPMYQTHQNMNPSFGFNGLNAINPNQIQNFYPVNTNAINLQNFSNNINRNIPSVYAPIMVLGENCMLVPVVQQVVMGYPQTTYYNPNSVNFQNTVNLQNLQNGKMNYMQPMMNMNVNGFFPNNSNNMNLNNMNLGSMTNINMGMNLNNMNANKNLNGSHLLEKPKMESKGEKE